MTQQERQPLTLPQLGFLRIWQIVGNPKTNTPALIPIGKTSFLNGVKSGKYPNVMVK
jgi:prophage regulatory protein